MAVAGALQADLGVKVCYTPSRAHSSNATSAQNADKSRTHMEWNHACNVARMTFHTFWSLPEQQRSGVKQTLTSKGGQV